MKFGIFYEHQLPRPWGEGDELKLDFEKSTVANLRTGEILSFEPIPAHLMEMVRDGGLLPHLEKRLKCRTTS